MNFPRLNKSNGVIAELWRVVQQICEILPDLVVKGGSRNFRKQPEGTDRS